MALGRPELFYTKLELRLRSIQRAVAQFEFSAKHLRAPFEATLTPNTALFLKGYGNEANLLSATRELFFSSRELLDFYLGRLSAATKSTGNQTPKSAMPFLIKLASGALDSVQHPAIPFMRTNLNYIFHIRKIRNALKSNPADAEFIFNTNHFEMRIPLTLSGDERALLPHLDVHTLPDEPNRYFCTLNLDIYFPEQQQFWNAVGSQFPPLDADIGVQNGNRT